LGETPLTFDVTKKSGVLRQSRIHADLVIKKKGVIPGPLVNESAPFFEKEYPFRHEVLQE
jgi:hypothetical protein